MLGQALHKFLARITACSKNRDFRFLHDVVVAPAPEEMGLVYLWAGAEKIQNSKLNLSNSLWSAPGDACNFHPFHPMPEDRKTPEA
jgi:hypothetical protein